MKSTLIHHISSLEMVVPAGKPYLKGAEMSQYETIQEAYVLIEDDKISGFGKQQDAPERADIMIDATGKLVLPGWCDSHTHTVFAGSREQEFVDKIRGLSYQEIAARGGGILNSAKKLLDTPEEALYDSALERITKIIHTGTTSLEIKSGYALTTQGELKMLRVIRKLKENLPIPIKATFLGAHAFPHEYKNNPEGYVKKIIDEMIPVVASEGLAEFIDVFCDEGFFTPKQTADILEAALRYGLIPKLHANELADSGGVEVAVQYRARSADHLEHITDKQIALLNSSSTMPTLLPSTSFFLKLPYAPARKMIDAGLPVALASDYNPGSSPSGNMPFVLTLSCLYLQMLPKESVAAATLNGAYAMCLEDVCGSIALGKKANLLITGKMESIAAIPYFFGSNPIEKVIINGKLL
ncbi:MAG: imidazolonepropionase [Chitinophagales bacterium]|nr:imidazolonepropionase [Chitinophagales bacterium]MDW8272761.1 imidazolonepropionase [Chitinophagales bacterium]